MNQKKLKALRRKAEALTVGLEARALVDWKVLKVIGGYGCSALNNPHTTRGVYRELKRQKHG